MYKVDLVLNNLQVLVWHKPEQSKSYIFDKYIYKEYLALNNLQWFIYHKTQQNQIVYI